ncbi:hypothetical protein C1H46_033907 [Malus baccata]|uniref:Ubiquitin-like protease family profile domain-containing protein n=1 Tax=Malus baccata TaxID=106549 RepID=A0A540L224_MALBA|nr:hypothetical protein C1H46_033907 [Malus baccata]
MKDYVELTWSQNLFEPMWEKLGAIDAIFFPIVSEKESHYTLLVFHKRLQKWTHYNPLRTLNIKSIERCIDIAKQLVQQKSETKIMIIVLTSRNKLSKNGCSREVAGARKWEKPTVGCQYVFEESDDCVQQDSIDLDCGMSIMFYMDFLAQGITVPNIVTKNFMAKYIALLIQRLLRHKNCTLELEE